MSDTRRLITQYLDAMQCSNRLVVQDLSAPGVLLEYPGGHRFESPAALFDWAKGRHRWIKHHLEDVDEIPRGPEKVVYVTGTLEGEWADGRAFAEIRFIYRFRINSGRFLETRLWSDVAESLRAAS